MFGVSQKSLPLYRQFKFNRGDKPHKSKKQ